MALVCIYCKVVEIGISITHNMKISAITLGNIYLHDRHGRVMAIDKVDGSRTKVIVKEIDQGASVQEDGSLKPIVTKDGSGFSIQINRTYGCEWPVHIKSLKSISI